VELDNLTGMSLTDGTFQSYEVAYWNSKN